MDEGERVESFIDKNTKWWDMEGLELPGYRRVRASQERKKKYVATKILKIELSPREQEEKLIQALEKDGKYSVKSVYRLLKATRKHGHKGDCSNVEMKRCLWRDPWNMKIPNKVKDFAWRTCKDCLPKNHNLKKRKVFTVEGCQFWNEGVEDTAHALYCCPTLKQ